MANQLTRFDPFNEMARFDPFRGMEEFFRDFSLRPALAGMDGESRIKMDVSETDNDYFVKAEMPGFNKEDIKVSIVGNQVSISAETKKQHEEKKGETVVRSERYCGQHYRSFTLANEINDAEANAEYKNGVLELRLPKKSPGSSVKKLTIK